MSNFHMLGNVNQGFIYVPQNVPRRGLSVAESEQAVRNACLAHALGSNHIIVNNPNSSRDNNVVIGAQGNNPIYVNNVGTMPTPGIRVMTPTVVHQRCGVRGCTENHTVHYCRSCGANNQHLTRNCPNVIQSCGVRGCTENHTVHYCRSCGANNQHLTRNCPNVVRVNYNGGNIANFGLNYKL